jgi:hypothetical protein
MLDTVALTSPYLSESDAAQIERACVLRRAVCLATGEKLYELTTGSLAGSWDSRVSVRVEREEWVAEPASIAARMASTAGSDVQVSRIEGKQVAGTTGIRRPRPVVSKQPCAPYLKVEGSVHKALVGHNVWGGPCAVAPTLAWFIDNVGERFGVSLPCSEDWTARRVDWAECFDLGTFEACEEYMTGLNMAQFPRRKVIRYGSESLFAPGRTTSVKVYHKGPEFHAHDRRRLFDWMDEEEVHNLQARANGILRFETSIKARKLDDDFGGKPTVVELTREYLERVHDKEVGRLLKEANNDMETVRTNQAVSRRLREKYEGNLSNTLFGTWLQLAALGEKEVKKTMTARTFYRQRKQISDAGVSWLGSDVYVCSRLSAIPFGFSPVRSDKHRLTEEHSRVSDKLGSYTLSSAS